MISEDKLILWASAPSETEMGKIRNARDLIEQKLKDFLPIEGIKQLHELSTLEYEVYLQGSYKNSTNIRFDSDVDIVVQINSVFSPNKSALTGEELQAYNLSHRDCDYKFQELKKDVFDALAKYFGDEITYKAKCLRIAGNTYRVPADVVPCFQHRVYKKFISHENNQFIEGIKFDNTDTNEEIINYPKIHYANGCAKNSDTEGNYKNLVRVFKNFKRELVDLRTIDEKTAPSYFIENLIYNCTPHCFDGNYQNQVIQILQFFEDAIKQDRLQSFMCANEQDMLFSEKKWNLEDAIKYINCAGEYFLNN